ncbi:MAG: hypothetical protein V4642_09675 [Bacteroidota bacterium]
MSAIKLAFFTVILLSCNSLKQEIAVPLEPIRYPSPSANYQRDSLYIASTIWQFIDKEYNAFDSFKRNNHKLNQVRIDVDSIFYSPDSLKLFSFVIATIPDREDTNLKYYHHGYDMVGYRLNTKEPWKIYRLGEFAPSGLKSYNRVREVFRDFYFYQFRYRTDYAWDSVRQDMVTTRFGYNIDHTDFWTKNLIWRKGSRLPGLYIFETKGNARPGLEDAVEFPPQLQYPDSLLKLYR